MKHYTFSVKMVDQEWSQRSIFHVAATNINTALAGFAIQYPIADGVETVEIREQGDIVILKEVEAIA